MENIIENLKETIMTLEKSKLELFENGFTKRCVECVEIDICIKNVKCIIKTLKNKINTDDPNIQ